MTVPGSHVMDAVVEIAYPLDGSDEAALDPLMERIGDARFVLLSEASHGTSDYYLWRARITWRLIREKGFNFIGAEGDWPDCYRVNRYVGLRQVSEQIPPSSYGVPR
jgi:erythromycin esterase